MDEPPRTVKFKINKITQYKKERKNIRIHKTDLTYIMGDFQCQQPPLERV